MQSSFPKRIMLFLILVQGGIIFTVLPYFVNMEGIIRELMYSVGLVLLIAGVFHLFFSNLDSKFDDVLELFSGPLSRNVQEFKLLYSDEVVHKLNRIYCFDEQKIIINIKVAGRWTDELIESLSLENKKSIKILVCGYTEFLKKNIEEYPEIDLFLKRLQRSKGVGDSFEVRTTSETSPNTVFISQPSCSIIVPFDAKSKKLFYIQMVGNLECLDTYSELFESLWDHASKHNG